MTPAVLLEPGADAAGRTLAGGSADAVREAA